MGGNDNGGGATPTSISIFDSYDIKTLWFEFGHGYLHWLQNANTLNLEVSISIHKMAEKQTSKQIMFTKNKNLNRKLHNQNLQ